LENKYKERPAPSAFCSQPDRPLRLNFVICLLVQLFFRARARASSFTSPHSTAQRTPHSHLHSHCSNTPTIGHFPRVALPHLTSLTHPSVQPSRVLPTAAHRCPPLPAAAHCSLPTALWPTAYRLLCSRFCHAVALSRPGLATWDLERVHHHLALALASIGILTDFSPVKEPALCRSSPPLLDRLSSSILLCCAASTITPASSLTISRVGHETADHDCHPPFPNWHTWALAQVRIHFIG